MRATLSGAAMVDLAVHGPVPMQYETLVAEIARCEDAIAATGDSHRQTGPRLVLRLRLKQLTAARDAWDAHVAERTPSDADAAHAAAVAGGGC